MAYNTGIAWSDDEIFLQQDAIPIGKDFLAVVVNPLGATFDDQILYILDLKNKVLAKKFDEPNRGYYWATPSGITSSFIVNYTEIQSQDRYSALYIFNKKKRDWKLEVSQKVTTGNSQAMSTPLLPGYFVNSVSRDGTLWLDVYQH